MNQQSYEAVEALIPKNYVQQGRDARRTHEKQIQILLQQKKLPDEGWSNFRIELLIKELSLMDSNNFPEKAGVGEREGRIFSELVAQRHYRLGHGIGRSGDVTAVQPKAAGSSIMTKLTTSMVLDLIRRNGVHSAKSCLLMPVATGMALMIVLLALRQIRPKGRYVLWPRIDQKSCFKCIISAGFEPVVIENVLEGDELRTDLNALKKRLEKLPNDQILCVMTTTSCFAPRGLDKLSEVAQLCKAYGMPHIVNNAYGVQSTKCMHHIEEGLRIGRIDAFVQSTDKNFLVPVGGSVVVSRDEGIIRAISQTYPGRASVAPTLDLFITLLSMGSKGYRDLCVKRKENFKLLKDGLKEVAEKHGEKVLHTPNNPISIAVSLTSLSEMDQSNWTEFGSMLFLKSVSGTRVVVPAVEKTIGDYNFCNWGSHSNSYPSAYLTAAAAIGMRPHEVETFLKRLDKVFSKFKRKNCAPVAPLAPVDLVKEDLEEPEAASNQSGSSDASPMSTRGEEEPPSRHVIAQESEKSTY